MKKQPEVTKQTRENLRNAFWKLYARKSIDKISIKEITDLAGYNRGTFYLYYKDIYQVLEEIENSLLFSTDFEESFQEDEGEEKLLAKLVLGYQKHKKYMDVLLGEHGDPAFQIKWKLQMKDSIREKLRMRGKKITPETEYLLEYHIQGAIAAVQLWFGNKTDITLEELLRLIFREAHGSDYF